VAAASVKNFPLGLVVEARDRRTIEVRQYFPLPKSKQPEQAYSTEMFFFFPSGFGLLPGTFKNTDFYRRSKIYMRLHSPSMQLKDVYDLKTLESPAAILRRQLPLLLTKEAPSGESLTALAQLLGAEVADAVDVGCSSIKRELFLTNQAGESSTHLSKRVAEFCADLASVLATLRRVRLKALAHGAITHHQLHSALHFCCEYSGAVIDEALADLASSLDAADELRDGSGMLTQMRLEVARTAETVNGWRIDQGFLVPWRADEELFTYRMGLLKKELQQSLYVNTRAVKRDPFVRNTAAMIAAGLAATWATLAQLPLWTGGWATEEGGAFLAVAVGAYILKDRIKEWVRQRLFIRWLPWDHDRRVLGDILSQVGLGAFTGRAKERFKIMNEEDVPRTILSARSKDRTVAGLTIENESVAHYARELHFSVDPTDSVPERYGVQERLRFSLTDFLARLDDPLEEIRYFDSRTGRFRQKTMPRVYHINLVINQTDRNENISKISRFRLVVNQKGVVRIEPVHAHQAEANG
jgi:hypothetical protein